MSGQAGTQSGVQILTANTRFPHQYVDCRMIFHTYPALNPIYFLETLVAKLTYPYFPVTKRVDYTIYLKVITRTQNR